MKKFVVFYKTKDMSVTLYANEGTESDIKEFYERTVSKIKEIKNFYKNNSNSCSDSVSFSCSNSVSSNSSSFVPKYGKFLDKILTCKIKTELISNSDFIKLLDYLNEFHHVYED
jgi:hypothetical protein